MKMAKIKSAMRAALEFNQAFNRHDVAAMMVLMSDDCVFENTSPAPDGTVYSGKEAVTQFWQDFFQRVAFCPYSGRGDSRSGLAVCCTLAL